MNGPVQNAEYFDRIAHDWDNMMVLDGRAQAKVAESIAGLAINPGDFVLDAGCGTGVLFPHLLPQVGKAGKIIGCDVAPLMLEAAGKKHPSKRIELVCSDILEFLDSRAEASLGAVICFSAFPHFENKQKVIEGFYHVLAPGRRFLILHVSSSMELNEFHKTLQAPVNTHVLPDLSTLKVYAESAGFDVVRALDEPGLFMLFGEKPR
ncbi:MAG: class I SAM-dependent methyltransferase [Spirochaetaceae bacterium]|nr:MAG: class I SAM-dependent methyltransferase [Spirochaetaceae bacterium]